jgi:hypothetical protein
MAKWKIIVSQPTMGAVDILELSTSYDLSIPHSKSSQGVIMLTIWSPSETGNAAYNTTIRCQIGGPIGTGNAATVIL